MPLSDERIEERIHRHRTAEVTLAVRDARNRPLAAKAVTVRQVRHKFLFGSNAFGMYKCRTPADSAAYRRRFAGLLNFATLPFYWGRYEPTEGAPESDQLAAMARWCTAKGIRPKGHPLCWHEVCPAWLQGRPTAEVESIQLARIARDVKAFAGWISTWDVLNEAVVMPAARWGKNPISRLCRARGRVGLIRRCFDRARKANPGATLILNDFDVTPDCERLLGRCIEAGVKFDVIGIQSHMHKGYWGAEKAWAICERFARFGKPLHFTELTILSGRPKTDDDWKARRKNWRTTAAGERRQAEQVAELYRVLFSHPAVEAVTWWDFCDQGAWQGAPAGFLRKDMTPKPSYDALKRLIKKDWWTGPLKLTTDAAGRVTFRGFLGDYTIRTKTAQGATSLTRPGKLRRTVTLRAP